MGKLVDDLVRLRAKRDRELAEAERKALLAIAYESVLACKKIFEVEAPFDRKIFELNSILHGIEEASKDDS